jgi:acyl-CoA synthetase (NDP forming)
VEADPGVDIVVVALGILGSYYDLDQILADVVDLDRRTDKLVVVCWVAGAPAMPARFTAAGLPTYDDTTAVMNALGALVAHTRFTESAARAPVGGPAPAENSVIDLPAVGSGPVSEYIGKQILRSWDLPVVAGRLAGSVDQAVTAAAEIGYPVVLKVSAEGLAHKTELGLVEVGIFDEATLRTSAERMLATVGELGDIDGMLIEPMVAGGLEMSVGLLHDPAVGNVVMVGAGGTATELLADVQLLIPPLSPDAVLAALRKLRSYPLLEGYRGHPPRDIDSFIDLIIGLTNSPAVIAGQIDSLDVNPVLVMTAGHGSVAVDVALTPKRQPANSKDNS